MGSRRRMSKAAGEMRWDSRVARTMASPFASISSGRYSFGSRSLITCLLVSAVSGVRLRIVSIGGAELLVLGPILGNDVVIVEIAVLGDIPRHPVARLAQDEEIEDAVVDGATRLSLLAQVKGSEALLELGDQAWFLGVMEEPGCDVEIIACRSGLDRSRVAVGENASPIPVTDLVLSAELLIGGQCLGVMLERRKCRKNRNIGEVRG